MIREDITKKQFLNIIKELNGGYVYNDNGRMIKFDINFLNEMKKYKQIISAFGEINVEQINWLSSIKVKNSYLPEGVMFFDRVPVGVIYPHYFEDYKELYHLCDESGILLIDNLKTAVNNNLELIDSGVVNTDFAAKNVLYKGRDVKLIDLSGRHIKRGIYSSYEQAYGYIIPDIYRIIGTKLSRLYGVEETKKILKEIKKSVLSEYERNTPMEIIENTEKMRVLK